MKAIIFAAGLGTRLKPITDSIPKALVKIHGKPMLEWVILKLKKSGITDIIINVHYLADQIVNFLDNNNNFGIHIELSKENELLDTGGGLKKAAWFFEGESDILVHNTDILSEIDLQKFYASHKKSKSDATLCVRHRKTSRYLLFNNNNQLSGWISKKNNETIWVKNPIIAPNELSFCGIHLISTNLLKSFNPLTKFSIIPEYLRWAVDHKISAYISDHSKWVDLGSIENINSAHKILGQNYFSDLSV